MMFTYLSCVLAMIISLWTDVSRSQCPEKCSCDKHLVNCKGQLLSTIPLPLSNATVLYLDLSSNMIEFLPDDAFIGLPNLNDLNLNANRIGNITRKSFKGLTQLQTLYLSENDLKTIEDGAFEELPNLVQMFISDNRLRNISRTTFRGLAKLRALALSSNALESIDDDVFEEQIPDLERLNLAYNRLGVIPRSALNGLTKLNTLYLNGCGLDSIDADVLEGMPNISSIYLSDNRLSNISRSTFRGLIKLQHLYLDRNALETIDGGVFKEVPNLNYLSLYGNRLRNISQATFRGLIKLQYLYLQNNLLKSIDDGVFEEVPNLTELHLDNNPLICDCQLQWLIKKVQDSLFNLNVFNAVCSEPEHLKGRDIGNVTQADLSCDTMANDNNDCAPTPCKNGATCINLQNAYSCTCSPGWRGNNCDQECGGVRTDPFGVIKSPNYPQDYEDYTECTWFINAPEGRRINVNFTDFRFESCDYCECDYLELFNEPNASLPSIGKFCGTTPPMGFQSQSNSVRIVLFTNNHTTRTGFRLNYTFSTQADDNKEQSSTIIWIATALGLCVLMVGFTTTACLCIRRKKKRRAQISIQLNELKPTDIPLELIERNSGNYDVLSDDNNEDNNSNYDVLPNDNNDNTDHYDVLPDDVHDDCIVPYAVVHLDNTEREATPMNTSLQPHITYDYLHTGLRESTYMIPASSYVLGRICESETSVQAHSAMAEEQDNSATSETKYKDSEELIHSTNEITTNTSAEKLFYYVENEDNFEAETDYNGAKQEHNYESGATHYTDFVVWENDTQGEKNKSSGIKEASLIHYEGSGRSLV